MEFTTNNQGGELSVQMSGRFTFSDQEKFREVVNSVEEGNVNRCMLDLSGVEFIDSAGLGMLILLNDTAGEKNVGLTVRGAQGQVRKMLDIANFGSILTLE